MATPHKFIILAIDSFIRSHLTAPKLASILSLSVDRPGGRYRITMSNRKRKKKNSKMSSTTGQRLDRLHIIPICHLGIDSSISTYDVFAKIIVTLL